ncbi:ABC transporter ATP-binding protein [Brevibacterium sp. UMB1308A]|uniref:energy-coupling factor ABC transporter ATP-binding protein n=1 Tax=Brevibacterium sp. UMB1308A TaxID=3050608 RepID=UPI00254A2015|nr:ABC transporter ATP-binding protein [Brevibacterium sp. UMB1308A]MDK8345560.1 ABC transporter ATP-binding protein [Brevibacterium sp. UMB1308B]MDK8712595.1 ABC transporter ATP-binding protein [Brevibacterium sp. UMB1308A]
MITFDGARVAIDEVGGPERVLLDTTSVTLTQPMTSVIGPNGSGKTTFLQMINGLMTPTSGDVRVGELSVTQNLKDVRKRVGFVFSDPAAQLVMPTVVEDVQLSLRHLPKAERKPAAMAMLTELGVEDLASRSVYELSGGQRQLVALATVLAVDPEVLVLDEPATLLDLKNTLLLRRTLRDLVDRRGVQVVFSTHDLDFALDGHECVFIDGGQVCGKGAPAEVVAEYRASVA